MTLLTVVVKMDGKKAGQFSTVIKEDEADKILEGIMEGCWDATKGYWPEVETVETRNVNISG